MGVNKLKKNLIILLAVIFLFSIPAQAAIILKIGPDAIAYFHKEIKDNPDLVYLKLGNYFFGHNQIEKSIKLYNKSININPNFAPAHHNLGIVYYKEGKFDKAIEEFKKAIENDKSYAKAYDSLALLYFELDEFDNAIEYFQMLTRLEPDNPKTNFDLAQSYVARFRRDEQKENLEDLKKALSYFKSAVELEPEFPYASNNIKIVEGVIKTYED